MPSNIIEIARRETAGNVAQSAGNLMVVDDNPNNLRLLEKMLRDCGFSVRLFPRGELALKAAATNPPELILLDIMMPDMDGYAVCQRLKADPALADIPVIFLSALNDAADKVKAFQFGGGDYIAGQADSAYGKVIPPVDTDDIAALPVAIQDNITGRIYIIRNAIMAGQIVGGSGGDNPE